MARKLKQAVAPNFTPPPYRWWFLASISSLFMMMLYPLFSQFIASDNWYRLSLALSIGISIALSIWLIILLNYNQALLSVLYQRYYRWMLYLLTPIIIYFMSYIAIIYGIGDLITQFSSKPQIMLDIVEKQYIETRKGCKTRLVSNVLKEAIPPNICISQQDFDRFPPHIAIKIKGRQSYFGFHVDKIEYDWGETAHLIEEKT